MPLQRAATARRRDVKQRVRAAATGTGAPLRASTEVTFESAAEPAPAEQAWWCERDRRERSLRRARPAAAAAVAPYADITQFFRNHPDPMAATLPVDPVARAHARTLQGPLSQTLNAQPSSGYARELDKLRARRDAVAVAASSSSHKGRAAAFSATAPLPSEAGRVAAACPATPRPAVAESETEVRVSVASPARWPLALWSRHGDKPTALGLAASEADNAPDSKLPWGWSGRPISDTKRVPYIPEESTVRARKPRTLREFKPATGVSADNETAIARLMRARAQARVERAADTMVADAAAAVRASHAAQSPATGINAYATARRAETPCSPRRSQGQTLPKLTVVPGANSSAPDSQAGSQSGSPVRAAPEFAPQSYARPVRGAAVYPEVVRFVEPAPSRLAMNYLPYGTNAVISTPGASTSADTSASVSIRRDVSLGGGTHSAARVAMRAQRDGDASMGADRRFAGPVKRVGRVPTAAATVSSGAPLWPADLKRMSTRLRPAAEIAAEAALAAAAATTAAERAGTAADAADALPRPLHADYRENAHISAVAAAAAQRARSRAVQAAKSKGVAKELGLSSLLPPPSAEQMQLSFVTAPWARPGLQPRP
jgi:hypothetical protein